jgi:hypothetical protein
MISSFVVFIVLALFTVGAFFAPLQLFTIVQFVQSTAWAILCAWFVWLGWKDFHAGWGIRHDI